MRLGFERATVDPQQPGLGGADEAVVAALGGHLPVELGSLCGRQAVRVGDRVLDLGEQLPADRVVALGLFGVVADHEPVAHRAVVDDHLYLSPLRTRSQRAGARSHLARAVRPSRPARPLPVHQAQPRPTAGSDQTPAPRQQLSPAGERSSRHATEQRTTGRRLTQSVALRARGTEAQTAQKPWEKAKTTKRQNEPVHPPRIRSFADPQGKS